MEVLARLYQEEGAALLTDAHRLANMLRDLCPEGTRRQQTMLVNALREGIPTALLFPSEPLHLLARRLAEKLEQGRLAFHRDDAAWVVDAWVGVLGKSSAIPLLATQGPGNTRSKSETITQTLGQEQNTRSLFATEAVLQPAVIRSSNVVESPGVSPGSLPANDSIKTNNSGHGSLVWIKLAFYFVCYIGAIWVLIDKLERRRFVFFDLILLAFGGYWIFTRVRRIIAKRLNFDFDVLIGIDMLSTR